MRCDHLGQRRRRRRRRWRQTTEGAAVAGLTVRRGGIVRRGLRRRRHRPCRLGSQRACGGGGSGGGGSDRPRWSSTARRGRSSPRGGAAGWCGLQRPSQRLLPAHHFRHLPHHLRRRTALVGHKQRSPAGMQQVCRCVWGGEGGRGVRGLGRSGPWLPKSLSDLCITQQRHCEDAAPGPRYW
jgi:hypothetical protein